MIEREAASVPAVRVLSHHDATAVSPFVLKEAIWVRWPLIHLGWMGEWSSAVTNQ